MTSAPAAARVLASSLLLLGTLTVVVVMRAPSGTPQLPRRLAEPLPVELLDLQLLHTHGRAPEQEFLLHLSAGHVKRDAGDAAGAAGHYEVARELAAQLGDAPHLVEALLSLGSARYRQGKLSEARGELEKAHALAADNELAVAAHALGNVRRELGHFDAAISLYEAALSGGAEVGMVRADMADARLRKGDLQKALGDALAAVKATKHADKTAGRVPEEDHELGYAQSILGHVYHLRGDLPRAGGFYDRALRVQRALLKEGHPDLVATQLRAAQLKRDVGDVAGAAAAVKGLAALPGPEGRSALALWAEFLRQLGQLREAEAAALEALRVHSRCCDERTPDLAVLEHILGSVQQDLGRPKQALQNYERALRTLSRLGSQAEVASLHNSLGTLQQDAGNAAEAERHFSRCLELQLALLGPENPEVAVTYNNLATLLRHRPAEAAALLRKALEVLDRAGVSLENPDRRTYEDNLKATLAAPVSV